MPSTLLVVVLAVVAGRLVGGRLAQVGHARVRLPIGLAGKDVLVHGSVGSAFNAADDSAEDMLRNADLAMYAAKGCGQGLVGAGPAEPARGHGRAAGARRRPAAGDRVRAARGPLPAGRAPGKRAGRGARGAGALAASRARDAAPRQVRVHGRGHRPDRQDRPLGARAGLRAGAALAGRIRAGRAVRERQHLGAPARQARLRGAGPRAGRRARHRREPDRARADREPAAARHRGDHRAPARAQDRRRAARDR
jgi:hypothetical protein